MKNTPKTGLFQYYDETLLEAGCDEAGRGPLAGPVYAAAVILKKDFFHPDLNDSKKVSAKKRLELRDYIEKEAIAFGVGIVDNNEIDKINILNASFLAMHRALDKLKTTPELLLIDGNRFNKYKNIKHICQIKGDSKYMSIAAASILAKTYRDDFMLKIAREYPQYLWQKNMGYPTKAHRDAVDKYGITPYHRKTFIHQDNQPKLF